MGVQMDAARRLAPPPTVVDTAQRTNFSPRTPVGAERNEKTPADILFKKEPAEDLRVGFGSNTINPPVAAMRTVRKNVQEARQLVPSLQELLAEARSRNVEESNGSKDSKQAVSPTSSSVTFEFTRADFVARARAGKLINAMDAAATNAMNRTKQAENSSAETAGSPSINPSSVSSSPAQVRTPIFDVRV